MRRIISAVLMVVIAVLAAVPITAFAETDVPYGAVFGDLDSDGSITAADALIILRYSVGTDEYSDEQMLLSDVDGDESLTAADALEVLRFSIGAEIRSKTGQTVGEEKDADEKKTLVAYFSRTGNTKVISEYIAELTGADIFEIEAAVPYSDEDIEYNTDCRANREQNDKTVRPEISGRIENIGQYDTIYLGYAIWWGQEPRIIDTFLESYDFSDITIIPFCTSASSGITASEKNIRELDVEIGDQKPGRRFAIGAGKEEVAAWLEEISPEEENKMIYAHIGSNTLKIALEDNSSAKAFRKLLESGDLTVEMRDYGGFEKVGSLGTSLPRNDRNITTKPGDVILYQGDQITIYYDTNSWSFTKLGQVQGLSQSELADILGDGSVTVIFSLDK